jgi:hypothetical protein
MSRFPWYRILMTALVLLVLTVPTARALEPGSSRTGEAAGFSMIDLFGRAWEGLVSLWMENGCIIDPNGGCAAGSADAPRTDNGCGIDPNGGCATATAYAPQVDNGCIIDPDGRCRSGI